MTDEAVIKRLNSTLGSGWGGLGVKLPWTGSGGSAMKYLTVTDFKSNTFSNGAMGDIADGEMFTFTSDVDAANGPGSALVGYAVKFLLCRLNTLVPLLQSILINVRICILTCLRAFTLLTGVFLALPRESKPRCTNSHTERGLTTYRPAI